MRPKIDFHPKTIEIVSKILKQPKDIGELKRAQCILFRVQNNMDAETIAKLIGISPGTVRNIHSGYLKNGIEAITSKPKGGRHNSNLSISEEKEIIRSFEEKAKKGGILEVSSIHKAYEAKVGRNIPKSTVYYMLARHGWRKLAPRSYHPKRDKQVITDFKKTSEILLETPKTRHWRKV